MNISQMLNLHAYSLKYKSTKNLNLCNVEKYRIIVPARAPDTVEAVGISYTEIEVDWTEIETKDRNGVLLGR